jgi:hypothetical protein
MKVTIRNEKKKDEVEVKGDEKKRAGYFDVVLCAYCSVRSDFSSYDSPFVCYIAEVLRAFGETNAETADKLTDLLKWPVTNY